MYRFFLAFIGVLLCVGCRHVNIPDGKYMPEKGEEYIVVKSSTIFFHLRDMNKPKIFINKKYEYWVTKRGLIILHGMTTAEFCQSIGNYYFNWNKKDILVRRRKFTQDEPIYINPAMPFNGRVFKRVPSGCGVKP